MQFDRLPDWRLDAPDDDEDEECPRCGEPLIVITRGAHVECRSCGWLDEAKYGDQEEQ